MSTQEQQATQQRADDLAAMLLSQGHLELTGLEFDLGLQVGLVVRSGLDNKLYAKRFPVGVRDEDVVEHFRKYLA